MRSERPKCHCERSEAVLIDVAKTLLLAFDAQFLLVWLSKFSGGLPIMHGGSPLSDRTGSHQVEEMGSLRRPQKVSGF